MSSLRPKRKAASNKSYNDSSFNVIEEDYSTYTSSRSNSPNSLSSSGESKPKKQKTVKSNKSKSHATTNTISETPTELQVPANWQPPMRPEDWFSNKLDLTDAYIDLQEQTLHCPNHAEVSQAYPPVALVLSATKKASKSNKKNTKKEHFTLSKGQCIYMISEPPGEPFYIGRIRGFINRKSNSIGDKLVSKSTKKQERYLPAKGYEFQIQWFFRPRDISRTSSDSRLVYATMDTDTCPLHSYRGRVSVEHLLDIEDKFIVPLTKKKKEVPRSIKSSSKTESPALEPVSALDAYTKLPNCFFFNKLYDRYMIRYYDVLLTENLLQYARNEDSTSKYYLQALHKRFKYIFCETQKTKSLINSFKASTCNCSICGLWCELVDSVICAECKTYYHMLCLDPPLLKKPSRGFSWSCAACAKKQEIAYHKNKMTMLLHDGKSSNQSVLDSQLLELHTIPREVGEEEKEEKEKDIKKEIELVQNTSSLEPTGNILPHHEIMAKAFLEKDSGTTLHERRLKEEWCMRYLGANAKLEEGVDLEDKSPYARASTRIGTRHQASYIPECNGHPIVYYDVENLKLKLKLKANLKTKLNLNLNLKLGGPIPRLKSKPKLKLKLTLPKKKSLNENENENEAKSGIVEDSKLEIPSEYVGMDPRSYPEWLKPRPKGYIERGVDDGMGKTCTLLWSTPEEDISDSFSQLDSYLEKCSSTAEALGLSPNSPNFVDAALRFYLEFGRDTKLALENVRKLTKKKLNEPVFNREEIKRFEQGVKEYGSELYYVQKAVKTQPMSQVVRYYYLWKKTKNGMDIWGNFEGRTRKKAKSAIKAADIDEKVLKTNEKSRDISGDSSGDTSGFRDDSSYEDSTVVTRKAGFICKHCQSSKSQQWFKITGQETKIQTTNEPILALCFRCARLWRRYAVVWDFPSNVLRTASKSSGSRKRTEWELLADANAILERIESQDAYDMEAEEDIDEFSTSSLSLHPLTKSRTNPGNQLTSVKAVNILPKKNQNKYSTATPSPVASKLEDTKKNVFAPTKTRLKVFSADAYDGVVEKELGEIVKSRLYNSQYELPKWNFESKSMSNSQVDEDTFNTIANAINNIRQYPRYNLNHMKYDFDFENSSTEIETPFSPQERKCCVCREHDVAKESFLEMLICAACGVNVHASCTGLDVFGKSSKCPKEWLCEPCMNDMKPINSTEYSCYLCYAKESNYELALVGSHHVRPDYLKSTADGRWCHLLCAIFSHYLLHLIPLLQTLTSPFQKSTKLVENKITIATDFAETIAANHNKRCAICKFPNGALVKCNLCPNDNFYHPTCAQDTPNYKLGFTLDETSRGTHNLMVNNKVGKLRPILVCPKHDQSRDTILNFRDLGRRIGSRDHESKPVVSLYLESLARERKSRFNNLLLLASISKEYGKNMSNSNASRHEEVFATAFVCSKCDSKTSPIWWPLDSGAHLCQSCNQSKSKSKSEQKIEHDMNINRLKAMLETPVNGENYGIIDSNDRVSNVYAPNILKRGTTAKAEVPRSKITIGDILI